MSLSFRTYKASDCITFKSTKGSFGELSNMAPNFPVYINGTKILSIEALYQALRFPDYPDIQEQIIKYPSPITAKKFGRSVINNTRSDWEKNRFKIMKFCLEIKLYQNYDRFSAILLSTQNKNIVEYTEKDKVWGATFENGFYHGTNALGRLLMELREKVREDKFELTIPTIENLKFLGQEINKNSVPNIVQH